LSPRPSPLRPSTVAIRVGVYIILYVLPLLVAGPAFLWVLGRNAELFGVILTSLAAAIFANALCMRIFEASRLVEIGLLWNHAAARNLGLGLVGGIGSAVLVIAPPLLVGAAHMQPVSNPQAGAGTLLFTAMMLLFGSAYEEMLFRGYAFQILVREAGPSATVLPVGVLFAALHAFNPGAGYLSVANTAGFGILFGYAFLRSHDLWLPIGLHFGWNVTLPLFGVNVSGLKIGVTGYTIEWSAGALWSGGDYGPEASVLTSVMMLVLGLYLWKAPVRKEASVLLDAPVGDVPCAPGQQG
jgi:CAAX protease family protein